MPERFAEVTGIFFEREGMEQVETCHDSFHRPKRTIRQRSPTLLPYSSANNRLKPSMPYFANS